MSSIFVLPPILFVAFREMYSIFYTLLGTLVLINFCTQLIIDLVSTFFKAFQYSKTIMIMPLLTFAGLFVWVVPRPAHTGIQSFAGRSRSCRPKKTHRACALRALHFLGGAAENAMTNWISGYMENALRIPKTAGDLAAMASFAILLGLGRTLYAKYGRNISTVLLCGMAGATVCRQIL